MDKQTAGLKRKPIDKFYTTNDVVNNCIAIIKANVKISENDLCIEPSAGNGAFIEGIKSLSKKYLFYDIEPENNAIIKQNFLELDYTSIKSNKIHVIGNPPFGRQSSSAIKFIKKACEFCISFSFILPKSFKKDSLKKHIPLKFALIHESEIPNNAFIINGISHNVPCVFQIWEKQEKNRSVPEKLSPKLFKFVKKEEEHDISFRRVGVNAGKVDKKTENKSFQSHYFIKFDNISEEIYKKIESIQFDSNNTVGPKSISKQEVIKEFNKIM